MHSPTPICYTVRAPQPSESITIWCSNKLFITSKSVLYTHPFLISWNQLIAKTKFTKFLTSYYSISNNYCAYQKNTMIIRTITNKLSRTKFARTLHRIEINLKNNSINTYSLKVCNKLNSRVLKNSNKLSPSVLKVTN